MTFVKNLVTFVQGIKLELLRADLIAAPQFPINRSDCGIFAGPLDFSGMSRIKLKTEEMEAQVSFHGQIQGKIIVQTDLITLPIFFVCVAPFSGSQVRVLQLENQLEQERVHLGELRKRHYELGGPEESLDAADSFPPPPPPTLLDSSGGSQAFPNAQPYLNTQSSSQINSISLPTSQPLAPTQSYTPASHYSQPFTSSQAYAPIQAYTPPQAYIPAQPYTPLPTQSYLKPAGTSWPHSPSLHHKTPQSGPAETKSTSRRSNIFTKSGNLLKNAVSA